MLDIGLPEIFVIALLALMVFGPDRLPTMAAQLGRWVRKLKESANSASKDFGVDVDTASVAQVAAHLKSFTPSGLVAQAVSQTTRGATNQVRSDGGPTYLPVYDPDAT